MDLNKIDTSTNGLHERIIFLLLEDQKTMALKTQEIELVLNQIPEIKERIDALDKSKISKPVFLLKLQANVTKLLFVAVAAAFVSWLTGISNKFLEFFQ